MAYRDVIIADAPVGYWRLGEPSGTTAVDEMGFVNGTYTNTPSLAQTGLLTGDADTAVAFARASAEYVDLSTSPAGGALGASIECWVQLVTPVIGEMNYLVSWGGFSGGAQGVHTLAYRKFDATTYQIFWGFNDGTDRQNTYLQAATGHGDPLNTTVHHLVAVHDYAAKTVTFYIDGAIWLDGLGHANPVDLSAFGTINPPPGGIHSRIGGYEGNLLSQLNGTLDEVAIYNYPLTHVQVYRHYNAGKGITGDYAPTVIADDPVIYYRLDEASGTWVKDVMGGDEDAAYVNTPTLGVAGPLVGDTNTAVSFASASQEYWSVNFNIAALDLGDGPYSIEFLIKRATNGNTMVVFDQGDDAPTVVLDSAAYGDIEWNSRNTGAGSKATQAINDFNWHHVVCTKSTLDEWLIYVDGQSVGVVQGTPSTTNNANNTNFARRSDNVQWVNGTLDEMAIYKSVLSPSQVLAHYYAYIGFTPSSSIGGATSGPALNSPYESSIQVLDTSAGPKVRTLALPATQDGTDLTVQQQVVALANEYGIPVTGLLSRESQVEELVLLRSIRRQLEYVVGRRLRF